jgi:predicted ATP-grasp superfamily ATP-dependent carboligase
MYTRYGKTHLLPPIEGHEDDWMAFLDDVGKGLGKPGALFVTSDAVLLFLSRNRDRVGKFFRFIIPDVYSLEHIVNKRQQYTLAEKAGIPVPKTAYPESMSDARAWALELPYPCILKPYMYRGRKTIRKKAVLIRTPQELVDEFAKVVDSGQGFMIQEVIPGESTALVAYHGFWDADGQERAWWTKRHVRTRPFADGAYHVTVDAPAVACLSRKLLAAFNYRGFSHVEFKFDHRDNSFRLMEINARTGQSSQHGIAAGIDLPWIAYCYLTSNGAKQVAPDTFKRGVTFVNEEVDLRGFSGDWRTGKVRFIPWLSSIVKAEAKAHWAWDDPGPALAMALDLGHESIRKASGLIRAPSSASETN